MNRLGPDPLLPLLQKELAIGERLRWHGRPREGAIKWAAFGIWLFAIPWTAFALFWTFMAWSGVDSMGGDGADGLLKYAFPLFGVPFILVGLAMLVGPIVGLFASTDRIHGITDRRIITLTKGKGDFVRVKSLQARHIGPIERWEGKAGRGKITIETHSTTDSDGDRRTETVNLIGIDDVKRVGELVRELSREPDANNA
ncbi:hypothetical protein [Sphingomicrobium marinum]|uniref:hypothetical protein n=1 Tax=Sphingomicrobium marinum TaxID=1227950 RepID=UPI00223F15D8|nr:hypothetical protein [Sphingomicrobium marinum]